MGRPSAYTPAITAVICARLAAGEPLTKICQDDGMPDVSTVYRWIEAQPPFRDLYARAREDQADTLADEMVRIADEEPDPAKARVRVDARKWVASKLKPKKYGDKVTQEVSGPNGAPLSVSVTFVGKPT
jgi:hypothetical protein